VAVIVMVGGDRLWVSDSADDVVEALRQARREEFCAFDTEGGTLHINPAQVAYVQEGDPPPESGGGRPREG
jgi:hypothetical protein